MDSSRGFARRKESVHRVNSVPATEPSEASNDSRRGHTLPFHTIRVEAMTSSQPLSVQYWTPRKPAEWQRARTTKASRVV